MSFFTSSSGTSRTYARAELRCSAFFKAFRSAIAICAVIALLALDVVSLALPNPCPSPPNLLVRFGGGASCSPDRFVSETV
eukprot:1190887-Prorocentrum_minimum.AAC.4